MAVVYQTFEIDTDPLHDVLVSIDNKSRTEEELIQVFYSLPEHTRLKAIQWGMGDTEVCNEAYYYLKRGIV